MQLSENPASDSITIREITRTDALAVSGLTTQLGYSRSADEIAEWVARVQAAQAEQIAFVACFGDEVVGWIEVSVERRLQSAPFAIIGGLVVSDRARNRRIGRRLCEHAEEWTWEQGLHTLRVTSRSTREGAHRFYLRDGYREMKTSLVFEKTRPPKTNRP